jgi:hypothetical protein
MPGIFSKPPGSNTGPLGVPPGGPWFANAVTGTVQRQSNPALAEALVGADFFGFPTEALADKFAHTQSVASKNPIKDVTGFLTNSNTWVRAGEVIAGFILLAVGLDVALKGGVISKTSHAVVGASKVAML